MSAGEEQEAERELGELMVAYQSGELSAFEELYRRLSGRLRSYLSSLTWSSALAEDLLQETFLQMHRSRRTHVPGRAVTPCAFAIARFWPLWGPVALMVGAAYAILYLAMRQRAPESSTSWAVWAFLPLAAIALQLGGRSPAPRTFFPGTREPRS